MIGKALLSGLWAHPQGCFTVRFTFALLALARVSLSVSLFFSPLSLRRGVVVVCFEVTMGELLCLIGLRHVISGILAGGIPGFRMVLLLLHSPLGMALWFCCSSFVSAAIPCRDDTMLSSLAWISQWTGACHSLFLRCCFLLLFCLFGLCWWFCFWLLFCFVWWWFRDGLQDYTQVLYQFTLEASQSADGPLYALIKFAA